MNIWVGRREGEFGVFHGMYLEHCWHWCIYMRMKYLLASSLLSFRLVLSRLMTFVMSEDVVIQESNSAVVVDSHTILRETECINEPKGWVMGYQ